MVLIRPDSHSETEEIDHDRKEAGFQKYFYRVDNDDALLEGEDEGGDFKVTLSDGNAIRYFFCRVMQWYILAWLRMCTFSYAMVSCGISEI